MIGRALLVVGSVLFGLLVLEVGCRAVRGTDSLLHWKNIVLDAAPRHGRARISTAASSTIRCWATPSVRALPRPISPTIATAIATCRRWPAGTPDGPPILATGDSYTQGDEVPDDQTWPAYLQAIVGRRTINAGVAAYGIDQTVLRTEQLAAKVKPSVIVVGFIADDLRRAEMRRTWGTEKPYFTLKDEELALHNVPVPPSPRPEDTLDFWHWALGWSVLVDTVLIHQGSEYEWVTDHKRATPPGTGAQVACALMKRLAKLDVPTVVVAQYDFYVWMDAEFGAEQRRLSQGVLKCAAAAELGTVDLYDQTEKAVRTEGRNRIYRTWHPSAEGYRLIAEGIAADLVRRHLPPGALTESHLSGARHAVRTAKKRLRCARP